MNEAQFKREMKRALELEGFYVVTPCDRYAKGQPDIMAYRKVEYSRVQVLAMELKWLAVEPRSQLVSSIVPAIQRATLIRYGKEGVEASAVIGWGNTGIIVRHWRLSNFDRLSIDLPRIRKEKSGWILSQLIDRG